MFSSSILALRKAGAALEHSISSDHGDVNNEKQSVTLVTAFQWVHVLPSSPRGAEWTGSNYFQPRYFYPLATSNRFMAAFIKGGVACFISTLSKSETLAFGCAEQSEIFHLTDRQTWATSGDNNFTVLTNRNTRASKEEGNGENWDTSCNRCSGSHVNRRIVSENNIISPSRPTLWLIVVLSSSEGRSSSEATPGLPFIHDVGTVAWRFLLKREKHLIIPSRSMIQLTVTLMCCISSVPILACNTNSQQLLSWPATPN